MSSGPRSGVDRLFHATPANNGSPPRPRRPRTGSTGSRTRNAPPDTATPPAPQPAGRRTAAPRPRPSAPGSRPIPSRILAELRRNAPGLDWLRDQWARLGDALRDSGGWDEAQRSLALDLLGKPIVTRGPDPLGLSTAPVEDLADLVAAEVANLEARKVEAFDELEALERAMAEAGQPNSPSGEVRRLQRYEAAQWRLLQRTMKQLGESRRQATARADQAALDAWSNSSVPPTPPPPAEPDQSAAPAPGPVPPGVAAPSRFRSMIHEMAGPTLNRQERRALRKLARNDASAPARPGPNEPTCQNGSRARHAAQIL